MSDIEELDKRIARLESLVKQQLCKCVVGPYWIAYNNCPLHAHSSGIGGAPVETVVADQRGVGR